MVEWEWRVWEGNGWWLFYQPFWVGLFYQECQLWLYLHISCLLRVFSWDGRLGAWLWDVGEGVWLYSLYRRASWMVRIGSVHGSEWLDLDWTEWRNVLGEGGLLGVLVSWLLFAFHRIRIDFRWLWIRRWGCWWTCWERLSVGWFRKGYQLKLNDSALSNWSDYYIIFCSFFILIHKR